MIATRWLSPKQIKEILGVSRTTAYEICAKCSDRLKFGRNVRITEESFQRWVKQHTVRTANAAESADAGPPIRRMKPRT